MFILNQVIKRLLLIMMALFLPLAVYSQSSFQVSGIDASAFDSVRASFVALNDEGKPYSSYSPSDFSVKENNLSMDATLGVTCQDTLLDPEVNILLIIDQSFSMTTKVNGQETRFQWVKEGVKQFLNTIKFVGRTKVGITTFQKYALLSKIFTNNKEELLDSLEKIWQAGGTEYDPPFLDYDVGAVRLFKDFTEFDVRRIAIFLTDGEPNHQPSTDSIIEGLQSQNIQTYCITLGMPMNDSLKRISKETGGDWFAVDTKEMLKDIYALIAINAQTRRICTLSWKAPYGCVEADRYRNVEILFKPQGVTVKRNYTAPPNSIASVKIQSTIVSFGDPPPANSTTQKITLKPEQAPFKVLGAQIQPSQYFKIIDWGGSSPTFTIDTGETRTITVEFTQGASKAFRQATLMFLGSPCPPIITLVGGYSQIIIVTPNGKEEFTTCDTVNITWAGVEPTVPVNLSYTTNNGASWQTIRNNVTGSSYRWLPQFEGSFKIRAQVSAKSSYQWAKSFGGGFDESSTSLAVTDDNLFIYVAGFFSDTAYIGDTVLGAVRDKDLFLAKFDSDGTPQWAVSAGSLGADSAAGVCVDPANNPYITGVCYQGCQFGSITPNFPVPNKPYCFLARYSPNGGKSPVIEKIGADILWPNFAGWGMKIRFFQDEIWVEGQYTGKLKVDSYQLDDRPIPTPFTAKWNANGLVLESLQRGSMNFADYSKSYDRDSDNNLYETGTFTGTKTFDKLSVKSAGGKDFYITKYGGTPGSEDLTDDVFYVYSPKLEFKINSADLGDCVLGQSSGKVFEGVLHNVGSLRVEIEDITKGGNNPGDFTINFPSRGVIIPPHDSINVEISFLPTETGFRSCDVTIKGICAQPVTLNVSGNGICSGEAIPLVQMGSQNLNIKKDSLVKVIFTNTNKQIIVLTPVIEGTHSSDFDWFDKDGNKQTTIPLEAGSSVDLIIRFNPTDVGLRTATLNYNLPPGCVNQKTDLNGYGIVADMSVTPVEWVDRRIVTVNDSIVIVKNNGAQFVRVLSVVLETPPAGDIDIISLPGFPKQINSGDTMQIPVRFTPADTITYSNYVLIKIDGMQGELRALLRGNGILPKIEAVWDCPEPVKPGKSSTAYLTVYNNSLNSPLFLYDVDFHSVTDEFDWKSGSAPKNVIIQKDTNEVFEVIYTPKGLGPRGVNIDIYHDAVKGDDPDLKDMIYVQAQCDGLGFTTTPSIDLGRLLICDENTKAIKVFNESWNTDLSITGYEFEGADSVAFSIDLPNELLIPGSESRTFSVKFNPSQFKTYKCKLHLFNSIDQDLSVELSGSGHLIYLSVPDKKLSVQPGAQVMLIVNADIIGLEHPIIDTVTVKIKFDDKMCGFVEGSLQSRLNGWTWSTPVLIQKNELLVAGKGGIQTPFSSDLFAVKFVVLLSDLKETALYLQPMIEDCQTPDTLATMIGVKDVCFVDGRLIKVNSINYTFGDARPNPAKDKLDIDLGIGLDAYTTLEIYNTMGERVKILIEKEMNAGSYNLTIPLDDIPSGVYNLRLISGPYTQTQKIIITK